MSKSYLLEVVTPERMFYTGDVEQIIVPTYLGDEGFLANHTWACKLLGTGELWIREKGRTEYKVAAVSGGFVEVRETIFIYADSAEWPDEIDGDRAQKAKATAENKLKLKHSVSSLDDPELRDARMAVMRATTRIKVKSGKGRKRH